MQRLAASGIAQRAVAQDAALALTPLISDLTPGTPEFFEVRSLGVFCVRAAQCTSRSRTDADQGELRDIGEACDALSGYLSSTDVSRNRISFVGRCGLRIVRNLNNGSRDLPVKCCFNEAGELIFEDLSDERLMHLLALVACRRRRNSSLKETVISLLLFEQGSLVEQQNPKQNARGQQAQVSLSLSSSERFSWARERSTAVASALGRTGTTCAWQAALNEQQQPQQPQPQPQQQQQQQQQQSGAPEAAQPTGAAAGDVVVLAHIPAGSAAVCTLAHNNSHLRLLLLEALCSVFTEDTADAMNSEIYRKLVERATIALYAIVLVSPVALGLRTYIAAKIGHFSRSTALNLHLLTCGEPTELLAYFEQHLCSARSGRNCSTTALDTTAALARCLRAGDPPAPNSVTAGLPSMLAWLQPAELASRTRSILDAVVRGALTHGHPRAAHFVRLFVSVHSVFNLSLDPRVHRALARTIVARLRELPDGCKFDDLSRAAICLCVCASRVVSRSDLSQESSPFNEILHLARSRDRSGFFGLLSILLGAHVPASSFGSQQRSSDAIQLFRSELGMQSASISSQAMDAVTSVLREIVFKHDIQRAIARASEPAEEDTEYPYALMAVILADKNSCEAYPSGCEHCGNLLLSNLQSLQKFELSESSYCLATLRPPGPDPWLVHLLLLHASCSARSLAVPLPRQELLDILRQDSTCVTVAQALCVQYLLMFNNEAFPLDIEPSFKATQNVTYFRGSDLLECVPRLNDIVLRGERFLHEAPSPLLRALLDRPLPFSETLGYLTAQQLACLRLPEPLLERHSRPTDLVVDWLVEPASLVDRICEAVLRFVQEIRSEHFDMSMQNALDGLEELQACMFLGENLDTGLLQKVVDLLRPLLQAACDLLRRGDSARRAVLAALTKTLFFCARRLPWHTFSMAASALRSVGQPQRRGASGSHPTTNLLDPLEILLVDRERVLFQPAVLPLFFRSINTFAAVSRRQLHEHAVICGLEGFASTAVALTLSQDSALAQQFFELVDIYSDRSNACSDRDLAVGLTAQFLHELFIEQPLLIKLVHFQGYPRARQLLPTLCATVPCLHIALLFVPELLARADPRQQVLAIALTASLSRRYPIPRSLEMCKTVLSALRVQIQTRNDARLAPDRELLVSGISGAFSSVVDADRVMTDASVTLAASGDPAKFANDFATHALGMARKRARKSAAASVPSDALLRAGLPLLIEFCRCFPVLIEESMSILSELRAGSWLVNSPELCAVATQTSNRLCDTLAELLP